MEYVKKNLTLLVIFKNIVLNVIIKINMENNLFQQHTKKLVTNVSNITINECISCKNKLQEDELVWVINNNIYCSINCVFSDELISEEYMKVL